MKSRGFTLMEMMIAAGIGSIITLAVFGLIVGQMTGAARQERVSDAQQVALQAMSEVARRVQTTGFGLPPEWAIGTASKNNVTSDGVQTCAGTDILEVRARDPYGFWKLDTGTSANSVRVLLPAGMTSDPGWPAGARVFVFSSIGRYGLGRTTAVRAPNQLIAPLNPAESTDLAVATNTAVQTNSDVHVVTTYRFRLSCQVPAHPVLLLEQDTDIDKDGTNDVQPLGSDVEDFQVAYLVDGNQDGIVTDSDAVNHPLLASHPLLLSDTDKFRAVKAIRISIVARALGSDIASGSYPITLEDHAVSNVTDRYIRRMLRQVISLDNRDTAEPAAYLHLSNQVL